MPRVQVMQLRARVSLGLALAGVGLGIAALATASGGPALLAGLCAVAASVLASGSALMSDTNHEDVKTQIENLTAAKPADVADYATMLSSNDTVIDTLTGLPDRRFFEVAVDGRVAAARRHLWPVSIVLVQCGFDDTPNPDLEARDKSVLAFSKLMRQTLREADIACHLGDNKFGLILEDTSEEGGVWTAERLQIALSRDASEIRQLVAGVAAYPTHGLFAKDVMIRAQSALKRANATPVGHGLGQVEVAHTDLG